MKSLRDRVVGQAAGPAFGVELVDQIDDIEEAAAAPLRMQARATAMARWVFPVPVRPTRTTLRW